MAEDYYKTLGVSRNASSDEIQAAYRKLARKYHPDLNPDDASAKAKFQEVQKAFDVLNDASKREMYDRYGSSFENMGAGGGGAGGGPRTYRWSSGGEGVEDVDFSEFFGERFGGGGGGGGFADIFSQFTRAGAGGGQRRRAPRRGADLQSELQVPFQTAVLGGEMQLSIDRGEGRVETISVRIPPGIEDGQKMRLRGQGEPAASGGQAGDILLTIHVASHPYYTRKGNNLYVKLPVRLDEALLGAKVDVPTPKGTVTLTVPPGTSGGARLRIKGHGIEPKSGPTGDLFAEVQIVVPDKLDEDTRKLAETLAKSHAEDPRRDLQW